MNIVLDIVGSMMIRSVIVIAILRITLSMNDSLYRKTAENTLRQNLAVASEIMYFDFKNLGFGSTTETIIAANPAELQYWADLNNDGVLDRVHYYRSTAQHDTTQSSVYRRINDEAPLAIATGVTAFQFTYFNASGVATTTVSEIRSFSIRITIEQRYSTIGVNPSVSWESLFFPPNI